MSMTSVQLKPEAASPRLQRKPGKYGHYFTAFGRKFPLPEPIIMLSFRRNPDGMLGRWPYRNADSNTKEAIKAAQNPRVDGNGSALDEKHKEVAKLLSMRHSMLGMRRKENTAVHSARTLDDYPAASLNQLKLLLKKESSALLKMELEMARMKNKNPG